MPTCCKHPKSNSKPPRRATIRDVAAETGLALSTVSNALSCKEHVSTETRARVHATAERLGYRASTVARALRLQRSFSIGVLVADVVNPFTVDFVRGVEDVAIAERSLVFVCNTDSDEERQLWHMRSLIDRQVDGMVLISQHCTSPAVREVLGGATPFVLVQRRNTAFPDDYVGSNNQDGLAQAIRYLFELGHRKIGFVRGPLGSSSAQERLETFFAETRKLGQAKDPALIFNGDTTIETGIAAGAYFLSMKDRPTALIGSSDMNSLGIIEEARARGLKVPGDLSVIGLDDIAVANLSQVGLTTVRLPKRDMGRAAGQLLMKRVAGQRLPPQSLIFPTELVVRATTGPPPWRKMRSRR